jgi:hypothetical protein
MEYAVKGMPATMSKIQMGSFACIFAIYLDSCYEVLRVDVRLRKFRSDIHM